MKTPQSYLVELIACDNHKRITACKPVKTIRYHTRCQDENSAYYELEKTYRGQFIVKRIKKIK